MKAKALIEYFAEVTRNLASETSLMPAGIIMKWYYPQLYKLILGCCCFLQISLSPKEHCFNYQIYVGIAEKGVHLTLQLCCRIC